MTEILQKLVVNCETGEAQYIPLTVEEIAQREADAAAWAKEQADRAAAEAARQVEREALLNRLGITADEAKLLLG